MWFSLLAFYVYFFVPDHRLSKPVRLGAAFALLLLAMQSTQTFAFFCMVPLSYLTVCDWKNYRRRILEFIALAFVVFLISTGTYKAGLHYWHSHGFRGYKLAESAMAAGGQHPLQVLLHSMNPLSYWSAFEIWSYPFPLNAVPALVQMKFGIALALMFTWAVLIAWAVFIESEEPEVGLKWLVVLVYLAFGAIFIVADSPLVTIEHRPHMVLTFLGIVVLSAVYALQVLTARYSLLMGLGPRMLGMIFVAIIAFGAQSGTLRGYVIDRMRMLDFIRTELVAQDASSYRNIVVVLPESHGPEPREFWVGRSFQDRYHMTRDGAYRYAMARVGIPPHSKTVTFVEGEPREKPADSAIVDWPKYLLGRNAKR